MPKKWKILAARLSSPRPRSLAMAYSSYARTQRITLLLYGRLPILNKYTVQPALNMFNSLLKF
jgi:hypothetical protein